MDFEKQLKWFFQYLIDLGDCYNYSKCQFLRTSVDKYFKINNCNNEFINETAKIMSVSIKMVMRTDKSNIADFIQDNEHTKIIEVLKYCLRVVDSYWMM
jgi:hypothetical protein